MARFVNNAEELKTIVEAAGSKLIIIDFFAAWCAPCKIMAPILEDIAAQDTDLVILKVDINQCEDLAEEYDIAAMPTFVFLRDKKILGSYVGANESKFKDKIEMYKAGLNMVENEGQENE